jgi:hypothetical protein
LHASESATADGKLAMQIGRSGNRFDTHIKVASAMCRNIRTLFNFEPPATPEEIRDASLQFVRKLSGFNKPSQANEAAFIRAVDQVTAAAEELIGSLSTNSPPKDRQLEAEKARERTRLRFQRP